MELAVVLGAFGFGFLAAQVGLPPMVGYLIAGFALHAAGFESTPVIEQVSDLGLLLLLFGIGLKLHPRSLARPTVWGTTLLVVAATVIGVTGLLTLVAGTDLPIVGGLPLGTRLLVGFALSFSSTVFAVKALEERNESSSLAGTVAIGVLIVQDLLAVAFLTAAGDGAPSVLAVPVVLLVVLARPLYGWMLNRAGHGELQLLLGFALVVGVGAGAFEMVGLKPDLGALVVGALLSGHPRANQLARQLLGLKDLLLVGFFLSIGLGGTPSVEAVGVAAVLVLLLPLKATAYLWVLTRLRLRSRTSLHASLMLSNYSEFGLIVAAVGVERGWLSGEWLATLAVTVSLAFVVAVPLAAGRYAIYQRFSVRMVGLQRDPLRPEDAVVTPHQAEVLVFGLGRVGTGAYDELVARRGGVVLGIDRSSTRVARHTEQGRWVIRGDALDADFWERVHVANAEPELVLLAIGEHQANLAAARRVREHLPKTRLAAMARWPDEIAELEEAGVDVARSLFGEAGQALADDVDTTFGS